MATFTTQPFHELLDSDKTTPSTVLDSDGKLKQSLHNLLPSADVADTDYWLHDNVTVTQSGTSPSGKAAYLITEGTGSATFRVQDYPASILSNRYYAFSVDVKRGSGSRDISFLLGSGGFGANVRWNLDLDTGDVTSQVNGTKDAAIATELSDGWWTFTVYAQATASATPAFNIYLADGTSTSYTGDGTSGIYVSRPRVYEASVHVPVERFENTDFATDTVWGKTNWTIGSGVASKTVGSFGGISQAVDLVAGEKYRIEVTVSNYVAGTLTPSLASGGGLGGDVVSSGTITANGTYVFILTALSSSAYAGFGGSATFDGDIDDVSLTKVIDDGIQNDLDGEDFIETSGSAIYHGGLEYNGDGSFRGIQSFEARTSEKKQSGQIGTSPWGNVWGGGTTLTLNAAVSPDGDLSATKSARIDSNGDGVSQVIQFTMVVDRYYTVSVFVKNIDAIRTRVSAYVNSVNEAIQVNWSGSEISSLTLSGTNTSNARYEDYGDGWYRVSHTFQAKATSGSIALIPENNGTGTESVYFWGAQLEAGSSPSPYIPTTGSTRSRYLDRLHKPLSEFGFNRNEYSVLAEFESAGSNGADFPRIWQIDAGTNDIRTQLIFGITNAINYNAYNGSSQGLVNNVVASYTAYDKHTVITSGRSGDQNASVDGGSIVAGVDDAATFEDVNDQVTTLRLASGQGGSPLNGYLKRLIIWPKQLTNDTIVAESE